MAGEPPVVSVVIPVYKDAERALKAVEALSRQKLPRPDALEIIVVNDGSEEDDELLSTNHSSRFRLVKLPTNQGRSRARNAGAQVASGRVLIFLDSDCLPATEEFLLSHMAALSDGAVASTGRVTGTGDSFWDRYQTDASDRRRRQHARGLAASGSSQNLAVLRQAFEQAGGFSEVYRHYGFEDRELLARLAELGHVAWCEKAIVQHTDELNLPGVARKMTLCAKWSACDFRKAHPDTYRQLGYAAIDATEHPWLRPLVRPMGPCVAILAKGIDPWLNRLPFWLAKALAKGVIAMAFLQGSSARTADRTQNSE